MRKLKAFTLIELLVVIAIIALLLSILMPSLLKVKEQAKKIVCKNNLKTVGMGEMMYSEASGNWHLPAYYWDEPADPDAERAMWFKNPLFITLVEMKGAFNKEDTAEVKADTLPKKYKCPSDKRSIANGGLFKGVGELIQGVSYAMNMMGIRPMGGWEVKNRVWALKVSEVVRPADKIFFMDGQWFVVYRDGARYKEVWDLYGDIMGPPNPEWDAASYRHNEGANITFYDGHVEYWRKEEVCPYIPNDSFRELKARNRIWMPIPGREFYRE